MFIETCRGRIIFSFDQRVGHFASIFDLPLWSSFRSAYSRPDLIDSKVLLILQGAHDTEDLEYSWESLPCYVYCLRWFLQNEEEVQKSALYAIRTYIHELGSEYPKDKEFEKYPIDELHKIIDLSYLRFYPETKDSLPYFGLEFECDWDPQRGCGLMFHGVEVVMTGQAEIANAYFDFEGDGAYVEL
jgi:hypothetical protein